MTLLERELPLPLLRWELPAVCLLTWIVFISIPLGQEAIGLSWDALNHHIYLGWIAETPRFDQDFLAAAYQSYQFPYLYWPVYKMAVSGWSGVSAGVTLATLHLIIVPPIWMLARTCMQGQTVFDVGMRWLAVGMALTTGVVFPQFTSTSNDLMAAAPLVWAIALALEPLALRVSRLSPKWIVVLSGCCAGAAVACKLSNGPLALVVMPVLWLLAAGGGARTRLIHAMLGGTATLVGFVLVYGYWGAQLWAHFGNPIYPFYDPLFASLRAMTGWAP
ncbi:MULTISPECIES: hypothetical protein [unclassified Polaromonas]|uniref:hypothetical protein n=1 Tax=unclassified Polaromonas TaxID=2638319 RepID=UPI00129E56A7|nr:MULTISPECIES: hypothetical protein [unclassified Polaromonas]QGJ17233.1 hypothetical protein F7R28_01750 [Polaromonas sp. Pch-P]